jgi:phosphate/sulfate permease
MNEIYLVLVIVLFALAVSDLIVGVANDAVNFLNSAIGSKSAPKWMIFGVAGLGVLAGSTFSSGMMEIARTGIFHPGEFVFSEIMIIFLAVMITDVILLDLFNTIGFPTSTTVSIVFELLGSAVAVAWVKINRLGEASSELSKYINSDKALAIISGILISVALAFVVAAIVQRLTRILFTFRFEKRLRYFGSLYGGIAIAVMTHFMIVKGAKGASFLSEETVNFLTTNMGSIMLVSIVVWTAVFQLLTWLFKIDILKMVVLVGTFALAWAFASNDLVNFIGVPLAGFAAFKSWVASGVDPDLFSMSILAGKVKTPTYMLFIAGLIMIATLYFSKKARTVIKTSVDLSRQSEGDERFGTSALSRAIVKGGVQLSETVNQWVPKRVSDYIAKQLEPAPENESIALHERPAFDKLRAATNLIVASVLISIGTSYKLPLSTTYVTVMVAMGSSLAASAWGRESAVYRVSGVMAVIGGWFVTAFVAFTISFVIARLIVWGEIFAIAGLIALAAFLVIRTHYVFRKKEKAQHIAEDDELTETNINTQKVLEKCTKNTVKAVISTSKAYYLCLEGFFSEDKQQLKDAVNEAEEFNSKAKRQKDGVYKHIQRLKQDSVDTGHFYVQVADYVREMAHSLNYLVNPVYYHFNNKHKPFSQEQVDRLRSFGTQINDFFNHACTL